GAAPQTPLPARFHRLGPARQSWTLHALGLACSPEAVDLALGPGQVPGLQRFSSRGKTSCRREPRRQSRDRAPHSARRETGLSAEAPAPSIPLPPAAPPALGHDGAHRCQPSRLAPRPRPRAHAHRLAGRRHPPHPPPSAASSPLTSNSKPKILSAISALSAPWSPLMASRSASTATATASSSATIPIGPSPNNSPENSLRLNSDVPSTNSASSRSPPTLPKPRAVSSAPGAPARTVWSANLDSP